MKKAIVVITVLSLLFSCNEEEKKQSEQSAEKGESAVQQKEPWQKTLTKEEIQNIKEKVTNLKGEEVKPNEIGIIETTLGTIKIEFYPDVAPIHCRNFKKLANSGFYDGTTFHRVIPQFVIQGGDILSRDDNPNNDGYGDPGYNIPAEFSNLQHKRGILSMARGNNPNSAGSQFFIMHADVPSLDGKYSIFGKVIEGMDVVDKIVSVERNDRDRPLKNVYMKKVRVVEKNTE